MKEIDNKKLQNIDEKLLAPLPEPTGGKFEGVYNGQYFTFATENWVKNTIGAVPPCNYATIGTNLTTVYSNGTSGVGATLTNSGTQSIFTIDGGTPALNSRILVKDQTVASENGIYTITNVGSASTNWVLTRAVDFDSASQVTRGNTVKIISGAVNGVTEWMVTSIVNTVGTDPFTFALLAKSALTSILGTADQILVTVANNIATLSIAPNPIIPGNASVTIPVGTTAQRPTTPTAGMIRFNTDL